MTSSTLLETVLKGENHKNKIHTFPFNKCFVFLQAVQWPSLLTDSPAVPGSPGGPGGPTGPLVLHKEKKLLEKKIALTTTKTCCQKK